MSIWIRIGDALSALAAGEPLSEVFDKLRSTPERSVAFTIAVIALGAKMAKADGRVTRDEVAAFREVFQIGKEDEAQAARVFNLARQDVAGFEVYATRIARMFDEQDQRSCFLMEGLFHIAVADGEYHPNEDDFLTRVADILGMDDLMFRSLRTRFVPDADPNPYDVLGVTAETSIEDIRTKWRVLVREMHPDRVIARGLPEEAVKLAEGRLVAINRAWEEIKASRNATSEKEPA